MLEIYAHPASQPSRSVLWLCAINGVTARLHHDPAKFTRSENPRQQIPVIVDGEFTLSEMPAILAHLADKNGWQNWYPRDLQVRARIQQYLHTHHTLTRLATLKLMAPHVLVAFEAPPLNTTTSFLNNVTIQSAMQDAQKLSTGQDILNDVISLIEGHYLNIAGRFIGGLEHPSIADLACYEEIAQLPWANLMQLDKFPNTTAWLANMATLPHHDAMHQFNTRLGDIASVPNTMDRMMTAIAEGLSGLAELGFAPVGAQ